MYKKWFLFFVLISAQWALSQQRRITTAVQFLTIAADARAAALGDMGVATTADVFSLQWNPAKIAFNESEKSLALSYTPYLESVVTDIALLNASYFKKINERSSFGLGMRYFSLGEIELRQYATDPGTLAKPNDIAIEGAYSLKLGPRFSMGVSGRFIRSNLKIPQSMNEDSKAASTFSVDVSAYYLGDPIPKDTYDARWRWGINISNLGPKIAYDSSGAELFLPTNFKVGLGYDMIFTEDSMVSFTGELNKLMVPTPQDYNNDGVLDGIDFSIYQNIEYFDGALHSFSDAPDGIREELKEVAWALSMEYVYAKKFMMRTGYYSENLEKGSKRFFSMGAGFALHQFTLDLSYLVSNAPVVNPLENTLRFSVTFRLDNSI